MLFNEISLRHGSLPRPGGYRRLRPYNALIFVWAAACLPGAAAQGDCNETVKTVAVTIEEGHAWRPPFGLDRVGRPITVSVKVESDQRLLREYYLAGFINGKETERKVLSIIRRTFGRKTTEEAQHGGDAKAILETYPEEIVLYSRCRFDGEDVELARKAVPLPPIQIEALARPAVTVNPVDLGTIFVPHDWLLLVPGRKTEVDVAAIAYGQSVPNSRLVAWFESDERGRVSAALGLEDRKRSEAKLTLEAVRPASPNDVLHLSLLDSQQKELWHKKIHAMYVASAPNLPPFGATELKLRYDPPISVNTAGGGKLDFIDYDTAWDPSLQDVVVTLPTGGRFVFWRGSSYIPFWVGENNTAMCYEWAETTPPPGGFVDSIEPLMDKELRYGRVEIIESTAARVHVRWTYQSTDFTYEVWGDQAVEDFYFYPDGFGTRVLSLTRKPGTEYELSEFIVLTPQSAYPLDILPKNMIDLVYFDGGKYEVQFPDHALFNSVIPDPLHAERNTPVVYRIRLHKDETQSAIYFHPDEGHYPLGPFGPFYDRGQLVTPAYWGSHWPLSRGKTTGWSIDDRIHHSPAHNSLLTWGTTNRPEPLSKADIETIDTLGASKTMTVERWAWLIGMSDASDARLLEWAHSFSRPPSVQVSGGELDYPSHAQERRAIRVRVKGSAVSLRISPNFRTVNPVFEFNGAPKGDVEVLLEGSALPKDRYAWDGKTLWVDATITDPALLEVKFRGAG